MFNLIVSGRGWASERDETPVDRLFEYTQPRIVERFKLASQGDLAALSGLPALFVDETVGNGEQQVARVGTIARARYSARSIALEYRFDSDGPKLTNAFLEAIARELDIEDFEFSRTHWAVKDVDLFRVLLRNAQPRRPRPRVFALSEPERIEPTLASAKMPFHPNFEGVFSTLKAAAESAGFSCRRADDIWDNPAVMQDIVSLIDHSRIVICDCTGRNPNVFYEIGIAHTLGREVILITQSDSDIPFDLRHLRYVKYLNNAEGLRALSGRLMPRLRDVAFA